MKFLLSAGAALILTTLDDEYDDACPLMKSIEGERDLLLPNTVLDSLDNIRRLTTKLMFKMKLDEKGSEVQIPTGLFKSQLGFEPFSSRPVKLEVCCDLVCIHSHLG